MGEHDPERIYEEIKQEHLRALAAGDVPALQRVQKKLDKLTGRERKQGKDHHGRRSGT